MEKINILTPVVLQKLVNGEYQRRARRGPRHGDAAAAVEAAQALLLPQLARDAAKGALGSTAAAQLFRLHTRLDSVGGEEEEVVAHSGSGARHHLLRK